MNTHNLDSRRDYLIQKQAGKAGLRGKLNAYCISCTFDQLAPGNWRQQVGNCTVTDCPLYPVRPRSETQQVKAALGNKKTSPEGLASNDITTDNGVGAPNTSTGGTEQCAKPL